MKENDDKRRSIFSFQLVFQRRKKKSMNQYVFFRLFDSFSSLVKRHRMYFNDVKEEKERITVESKQIQQMTIRTYVGLESLSGNNDEKQIDK